MKEKEEKGKEEGSCYLRGKWRRRRRKKELVVLEESDVGGMN